MTSATLFDLFVLLTAAVIIVPLCQTARIGAVPGFLVAGVLVGPHGLGLISTVGEITDLSEIGVILLLFVIGIELKPSRMWHMRTLVFGLGSLQVLITGAVLGILLFYLFGMNWRSAALVGPTLALSSTAFVLQLLAERGLLKSWLGRTSTSVLLFQDLAVVPLLALVPLLAAPEIRLGIDVGLALLNSVLIVAFLVWAGRFLLNPVLRRVAAARNAEIFTASAVLIVLATSLATEHAGLSMAMGAFLTGLLISDSLYRHQVVAELQPFRGLFLGLFFMSMGMSFNLEFMLDHPVQSIALVIGLMLFKALMLLLLCLLFRFPLRNSLAAATLLAQSGEFALVLFSLAFASGLLEPALFQQLLVVVLLSLVVTPALAHYAAKLAAGNLPETEKPEDFAEGAPIVLAGFGRVGRRIGEILNGAGEKFIAFDADPYLVERNVAAGHPVFFGDARKPHILSAAGAADAEIIIVTLNDPGAALDLVSSLRNAYPDKRIYARGHSLTECQKLRAKGATGVVSENLEASIELARIALENLDIEDSTRVRALDDFRRKYQTLLDGPISPSSKNIK